MKNVMRGWVATLLLLNTLLAVAEPNWQAIEEARRQKQDHKAETAVREQAHASAMQKLQRECERVKSDSALAQACENMMKACAEMMQQPAEHQ